MLSALSSKLCALQIFQRGCSTRYSLPDQRDIDQPLMGVVALSTIYCCASQCGSSRWPFCKGFPALRKGMDFPLLGCSRAIEEGLTLCHCPG